MRQPWRRWGGKQILLFAFETVVLAWLILLIGESDEVPGLVQVATRVLGWAILMVGLLVLIGWVQGRRSDHRSR